MRGCLQEQWQPQNKISLPLATISCLETLTGTGWTSRASSLTSMTGVDQLCRSCLCAQLLSSRVPGRQFHHTLPRSQFLTFFPLSLQPVAPTLEGVIYTPHLLRFLMVELEFKISPAGFQVHHRCLSPRESPPTLFWAQSPQGSDWEPGCLGKCLNCGKWH